MQAFVLDPTNSIQVVSAPGAILAEEVTINRKRAFHKGHLVETRDLDLLSQATASIHAVRLAVDDVHEDEAARRLGVALAGPGVIASEPRQRRVNMTAATRGVVTTETMTAAVRERFRAALEKRIAWYGGSILGFVELEDDPSAMAATIESFVAAGADVILTSGGNTIDPLDPAILALPLLGAEMIKFGAPSHPGSMFWLAYRDKTPVFNLASCSMYSGATSADLVLPWVMAGETVTPRAMAELGHGGLLEGCDMKFRFPDYDGD